MQESQKKEKSRKNCPFCGKHILYGKSKEALQIISVCDADNPKAEAYFQCAKCGKKLGLQLREISQ